MRKILQTYPICRLFLAQKNLKTAFHFNFWATSFLLISLTFFNISKLQSQDFETRWQVTGVTAADLTVVLPNNGVAADYNFNINWGDGTIQNNVSIPEHQHTYAAAGTYTVTISGTFERFDFAAVPASAAKLLSVDQWGNISMSEMRFTNAINFQINAPDAPDLSRFTSFQNLFSGATTVNADLSGWVIPAGLTNMSGAFLNATSFNGDLSTWTMDNVTNVSQMFEGAASFNRDIGGWIVNNVINMSGMFTSASSFNQDISGWATGMVNDMSSMFSVASIFNQNIGGWNTQNVENMSFMFQQATAFNQDIGNWQTGNVQNMSSMFNSASSFNQDISAWNTSMVTDMNTMFSNASAFNQDISGWNTPALTDLSFIFNNASAFNHSLGNWDISDVVFMVEAFSNSGLSTANYDSTLIGWEAQTVQPNVPLGSLNIDYCLGIEARTNLINNSSWVITGDTFNCDSLQLSIIAATDGTEGTSNVTFTIGIDGGFPNTTGADIMGAIALTGGTATNGTDYTIAMGNFTIGQGDNDTVVIITVVNDTEVEPTENVTVTISNPSVGSINLANEMATANIIDNDGASLLYSITATTDGTEGAADVTFTISIDGGINNTTGTDITGTVVLTGGTATNGTDYTDVIDFRIPTNTNNVIITVPVIDDTEIEPIETFTATISNPSIGNINTANETLSANIIDNDVFMPSPNLAVSKTGTYIDTNNDGVLNVGDQIEYTFSIENNGNVNLTNITITDPLPGIIITGDPINLSVGEVNNSTFGGIYDLTEDDLQNGSVMNQAFAIGRDPGGIEIVDFSDDPNDNTNVDDDSDGDAEDMTVTSLLEEDQFIIYEIITPNGDNLNDEFRITGLDKFPDNRLVIYNRWGDEVFQADAYEQMGNSRFDGFTKDKGKPLPSGAYFFVLEYKNQTGNINRKSGYVYIN